MSQRKRVICLILLLAVCLSFFPFFNSTPSAQAESVPVFNEGFLSAEPTVIFDPDEGEAGLYKMWYTRGSGVLNPLDDILEALLTAAGTDLIEDIRNFNFSELAAEADCAKLKDVLESLAGLSAEDIQNALLAVGTTISYATSEDGVNWTWEADVTWVSGVVTTSDGSWDAGGTAAPTVIRKDASNYEMWYTGWTYDADAIASFLSRLNELDEAKLGILLNDLLIEKNLSQLIEDIKTAAGDNYLRDLLYDLRYILEGCRPAIGLAVSSDGISWEKQGKVLEPGDGSAWDNYGVFSPTVIQLSDGTYEMWYSGFTLDFTPFMDILDSSEVNVNAEGLAEAIGQAVKLQIGYASSEDGTVWTKHDDPVMESDFDDPAEPIGGVLSPAVLKDVAGNYHMYYTSVSANPLTYRDFINTL